MRSPPVVGVVCDRQFIEDAPYLVCEERYVAVIRERLGVVPFLIPSVQNNSLKPSEILPHFDGFIFTGAPSNLHPSYYDPMSVSETPNNHDTARDQVTMPLLEAALEAGIPLLATCRGMQELNVACGGTLYQKVHETEGYIDHREKDNLTYEEAYAPAHTIQLAPDGFFAHICGSHQEFAVNSLHGQGIKALGENLVVEATACDGLIEAVRHTRHPFAVGTQFHPEWGFGESQLSMGLFMAFGRALRHELDLNEALAQNRDTRSLLMTMSNIS